MNNLYKMLITVVILLTSHNIQAQTEDFNYTLQGKLTSISEHPVNISITLVKTATTLVLHQTADDKTTSTTFHILSTTQNWDTETALGTATSFLNISDLQAEFILTGTVNGISAFLRFINSETEQETYLFAIHSISYQ